MTGAILNILGFIKNGKYEVYYEICGTFFFVTANTALTANHVLFKDFFSLSDPFKSKQSFLVGENNFIQEVKSEYITEHKNIDLSIIKFPKKLTDTYFEISRDEPTENQTLYFCGYNGDAQPEIEACNDKFKILLKKVDLSPVTFITQDGYVKKLSNMTLKSADFDLNGINVIELSHGGYAGMSGGPVVDKTTGKIIGLLSFGDTEDADKKDTLFALDNTELIKVIN